MRHSSPEKSIIHRWAMYDWANSVYSLIITSTFLPEYYVSITSNPSNNDKIHFLGGLFTNTSLYSYTLAFSFLIVAIISPLLAAMVDLQMNRKKFLLFFLLLGSIACMNLFFFTVETLNWGIIMIMLACIGFWSTLVFYNAYLPEITTVKNVDKVSSKGYKYGYVGSFLLQMICLGITLGHEWLGIEDVGLAVRISFVLVGVWWLGFGIYALAGLPSTKPSIHQMPHLRKAISQAYIKLFQVGKEAIKIMLLRKFLLAYLFFNMGIQVVMLVATIYGAKELNIPTNYLIITIILIQLLAIAGADLAAVIANKIGNFLTLLILSIMWVSVCIIAYLLVVGDIISFCLLGSYVGLLMGGSQSLNRSTYAKMIPKTIFNTVYFSFYDMIEKVSIVIGMVVFAFIEDLTGSMRNSVVCIGIFFIIASFLLGVVHARSKKQNILHI